MLNENAPRIRTEVQVMFFDTDCAAVVHNIAYLRFIEIDYRCAARLGDKLVVEGWLDRLERVRFCCAFKIIRPADETVIAECRQMLAIIQMPEAKLLRVPNDWDRYRIGAA
jgi:acyl-CoA thioesterase FadM